MAPAVRAGATELSYQEIGARAAAVAATLARSGLSPGDRVAIVLRNEPTFLAVTLGAGLAGAVPVPLNWHWTAAELRHVLSDSASGVVFVHSDLVGAVEAADVQGMAVVEVPVPDQLADAFELGPAERQPTGRYPLLEDWAAGNAPAELPSAGPPMSVIYTSGTTGLPKGILRDTPTPEMAAGLLRAVCKILGLQPGAGH